MNVKTFKSILIKSGTKQSPKIYHSYLKLENILQEVTQKKRRDVLTDTPPQDCELWWLKQENNLKSMCRNYCVFK